ncbi:addiction module protein [Litoribrevibacter albus]|uniref:Addiction module antitoxin RelB n=1 Tax=Litoribrevibacter albus TaxID=1473156 RepID=A0AA37W5P3_9GAMM|nr:addiction module protein [Litoribrevibacter albus]GLQ29608.1 hypothetical protein GCM10007876_00860 [Litoribrevibacter albus]
MATEALDELHSQALTLSESDRAQLAHDLLKSLDIPADKDVSGEWDVEIERRIEQIDSDSASFLDRDTFRRQMEAKIKGK